MSEPAEVPMPTISPLRAIAMGAQLPRTLRGAQSAIAVNNLQQFKVGDRDSAGIVESMYATSADAQLGHAGKDAFAAMKMIQSLNQGTYTPAAGAQAHATAPR